MFNLNFPAGKSTKNNFSISSEGCLAKASAANCPNGRIVRSSLKSNWKTERCLSTDTFSCPGALGARTCCSRPRTSDSGARDPFAGRRGWCAPPTFRLPSSPISAGTPLPRRPYSSCRFGCRRGAKTVPG